MAKPTRSVSVMVRSVTALLALGLVASATPTAGAGAAPVENADADIYKITASRP